MCVCRDPEKDWDRSKIKGLVANLFTVTDVSNATALEVVAGGRLYNVVVDNEVSFYETCRRPQTFLKNSLF